MSNRVDIRISVDGVPVPLSLQIAKMIFSLVEHRENIHRLGNCSVVHDVYDNEVAIKLLRMNLKAKARNMRLISDGSGYIRE